MSKSYKLFFLIGCIVCITSSCTAGTPDDGSSSAGEETSAKDSAEWAVSENATGEAAEALSSEYITEETVLFPESYTRGSEHVKFSCELEIPEAFDAENFYLPQASGDRYLDMDAAYQYFVEGKKVAETYLEPSEEPGIPDDNVYFLEDGTSIFLDGGINYHAPESSVLRRVMLESEAGASKENFAFGTGEECTAQLKDTLAEMDFPVEEFQFYWFSLSGEEHAALEQERLAEGSIRAEDVKEGGWTQEDDAYEIYAWQIYQGLPVFPRIMSLNMQVAYENYQKAPVSACFSQNGMQALLAEEPYLLEPTDVKADFLSFEEIADRVIEKYERLLLEEGTVYTVERAMLAVRIYDEASQYGAEPIWYFEVTNNMTYPEVLMFNAITGEEIYLQS